MSQELANKALVLNKEIIDGWKKIKPLIAPYSFCRFEEENPELASMHSERCHKLLHLFAAEFPHPAPINTRDFRKEVDEFKLFFDDTVKVLDDPSTVKMSVFPALVLRHIVGVERILFNINKAFCDGDTTINGWNCFNQGWRDLILGS